jgi:hypothetical protein
MTGVLDWNAAAAIASAVSALAAAVSAFLSLSSLRRMSRIAKEQRASQASFQLIDLSLKHKALSTSRKGEDYEWYVVAVLEWAREILLAYPHDIERRNQVGLQLWFCRDKLAEWQEECPGDIQDYGSEVTRVVAEVVARGDKLVRGK